MQIQQQGCFACRTEEKCNQIRNSPFLLLAPTTLDAQLFSIDDDVRRHPVSLSHSVDDDDARCVVQGLHLTSHIYQRLLAFIYKFQDRICTWQQTLGIQQSAHSTFLPLDLSSSSRGPNPIQTAIALRMQMQTFLYAEQCPSRLAPTDRPTGSEVHARGDLVMLRTRCSD